MKYSQLEKKLRALGCEEVKDGNNGHPKWINLATGQTTYLSNHRGKEIATGTYHKILKALGLK